MASKYSRSAYDVTPFDAEHVARLAEALDEEAFRVTQRSGTERPFCGTLLDNKTDGVYCCIVCGLPLFSSVRKFDSGTGWPSFNAPFDDDHVTVRRDDSHGMVRAEIACARCDAHLGHVFDDGPAPTRQRHCLNSAALRFYADGEDRPPESRPIETETAYFAGGCFWGIEHYFQIAQGVIDATSGYMHGPDEPSYEAVSTGTTGHAETVRVVFDPTQITYAELLAAFFRMHDPTEVDRQGPDVGPQYRSGVYPVNDAQRAAAEACIAELTASNAYAKPIVTEVVPAAKFWPAEAYHQDYLARTGRACHVANPWV